MSVTVHRLAPGLAAEIRNIDLSLPLDAKTLEQVRAAWLDNVVLVFRGQKLSDQQLVAFSRLFGDLDLAPPAEARLKHGAYAPDRPEVTIISNVVVDGMAIGALGNAEAEWHTDMSYAAVPPSASLLYALEIPNEGGDTWFCNMYSAYDTLPEPMKRRVENLRAIHDNTYTSAGELRKGFQHVEDVTKAPGARHPVVRIHPSTGRKALFLGRRKNGYLLGLPVEESERLLDELWAHSTQDRFTYKHQWRVGDVVMWDNRCAMHRRDAFDPTQRRIMHRTQVKGDVPVQAMAA
jgi:taurine dioxygenase